MIYILWCKIDTTLNFIQYLQKVPKSIQNDILRYRKQEDQWAKLLGKLLVLEGMNQLGYEGVDLNTLQYTIHKRPYLLQKPDFNISHSGTYVMCAFSDKNSIGIDIEEAKEIDINDFKNMFSTEEWFTIQNAENSLQEFYSFWTAKESLLKADGRGITVVLDKVKIETPYGKFENKEWFLKKIDFNSSYVVHIASDMQMEKIIVKEIMTNQLLK